MQPRNGRSRRDGGRSIVWSWWRCRSRWRDTGTWRDLLKSARRRLEARANCAILYTDNALMKHCPCPTPVDRCRPPRVSSLFLSLSLSLRFFHFSFYFLYSFSNTRERQRHKSCREILSKRWKDRSNKRSVWNNEPFFEDDERDRGIRGMMRVTWTFFLFFQWLISILLYPPSSVSFLCIFLAV